MKRLMNGVARFTSKKFPNYRLNVYGTSAGNGKNVCLHKIDPNNPDDPLQTFAFQSQGNNAYKLSVSSNAKLVLDHYRETPKDNCDIYNTGYSNNDGSVTDDLLDQQVYFDEVGTSGVFYIRLYNNNRPSLYLTCSSTADGSGCGIPSSDASVSQKNNVYWADRLTTSQLERQQWIVERVSPVEDDFILDHAQGYCQRDKTWDYLTTSGEFESIGCAIPTAAAVAGIMEQDDEITPQTMQKRGIFRYGYVAANWTKLGNNKGYSIIEGVTKSSTKAYHQTIHDEIRAGRPVVIRTQRAVSGIEHWVTAYGLTHGTTRNNVDASRILMLDPWSPELTRLSQLNGTIQFLNLVSEDF